MRLVRGIPQLDGGYEEDLSYSEDEEEEAVSSSPSEESEEEEEDEDEGGDEGAQDQAKIRTRSGRISKRKELLSAAKEVRRTRRGSRRGRQSGTEPSTSASITGKKRGRPAAASGKKNELKVSTLSSTPTVGEGVECGKCGKHFDSAETVGKHMYWCESSRITRSRDGRKPLGMSRKVPNAERGRKGEVATPSPVPVPLTATDSGKRRRGRPPKVKNTEQMDLSLKHMNETIVSSAAGLLSSPTSMEDAPAICPKCKMRYRNAAALEKHVPNCVDLSGSEEEREKEEEVGEGNHDLYQVPQQHGIVQEFPPVVYPSHEEVEEFDTSAGGVAYPYETEMVEEEEEEESEEVVYEDAIGHSLHHVPVEPSMPTSGSDSSMQPEEQIEQIQIQHPPLPLPVSSLGAFQQHSVLSSQMGQQQVVMESEPRAQMQPVPAPPVFQPSHNHIQSHPPNPPRIPDDFSSPVANFAQSVGPVASSTTTTTVTIQDTRTGQLYRISIPIQQLQPQQQHIQMQSPQQTSYFPPQPQFQSQMLPQTQVQHGTVVQPQPQIHQQVIQSQPSSHPHMAQLQAHYQAPSPVPLQHIQSQPQMPSQLHSLPGGCSSAGPPPSIPNDYGNRVSAEQFLLTQQLLQMRQNRQEAELQLQRNLTQQPSIQTGPGQVEQISHFSHLQQQQIQQQSIGQLPDARSRIPTPNSQLSSLAQQNHPQLQANPAELLQTFQLDHHHQQQRLPFMMNTQNKDVLNQSLNPSAFLTPLQQMQLAQQQQLHQHMLKQQHQALQSPQLVDSLGQIQQQQALTQQNLRYMNHQNTTSVLQQIPQAQLQNRPIPHTVLQHCHTVHSHANANQLHSHSHHPVQQLQTSQPSTSVLQQSPHLSHHPSTLILPPNGEDFMSALLSVPDRPLLQKYRKVLPHIPRPIVPKEPMTCPQPSVESPVPVKIQLANMLLEKQNLTTEPQPPTNEKLEIPRKNPVLTAVVRPMEHPLQKLSDQISQIESTFNSRSPVNVPPPTQTVTPQPPGILPPPSLVPADKPGTEEIRDTFTPTKKEIPPSPSKLIKLTLHRKENGCSYSVKNVSETGDLEAQSKYKSLKISARITTGELSGTRSVVVVQPKIHIIPFPGCPDSESEDVDTNLTIPAEDSNSNSAIPPIPIGFSQSNGLKLAYRAVVVYEVLLENRVIFRSPNVRAIWSLIFENAQGTTLHRNLPPLSYPQTISPLVDVLNNMSGLTHRAVEFLLNNVPMKNKETRFKENPPKKEDSESNVVVINETGCARSEGYSGRKPFDMFGWLASKHRKPLEKMEECHRKSTAISLLGMPMAYRHLKERKDNSLMVMWSIIHGRGLYTQSDIEKGEMVIEYAGEVIRSLVCDQREKYYETKGIGCYMFRINDEYIIDATMKGNAARFINHSCEPNCESRTVDIAGVKRIIIFSRRKIYAGEELTYDYKFEKETENRIPCTCGSGGKKCKKFLN